MKEKILVDGKRHPGSIQTCAQKQLWHGTAGYLDQERNRERQHLFGKPDATDEEIICAAKEARSWEFIRRLPKGLDTVLHEDSISQGQKQLLCITRVMLCLPPMLILDEATSSIDTRTELQVQEAFDKLMKAEQALS